jgi:hypothetical protein
MKDSITPSSQNLGNFEYPSSFKKEDVTQLLADFNSRRLRPEVPHLDWRESLFEEFSQRLREGEWLEEERAKIQKYLADLPSTASEFMTWFEGLKQSGPGQHDPLFPWLAEKATYEEMRWFIQQEVAGEAGFDDLVSLTMVKLPTLAKLELGRNLWDELGRGHVRGMHGPMLGDLARELNVPPNCVEESTALANLMLGLAANRRFAYHSIGALGVIELTAPDRAKAVYLGLKRLGVSPSGQRYFLLHSTLDVQHSLAWNKEAIAPLVESSPRLIRPIAEGALMRLEAGRRCFERYRKYLWNSKTPNSVVH